MSPRRFCILGVLSLLVYGSMTWLSRRFVYGQGHLQRPIPEFIGLYLGAWTLYMLALRGLPRLSDLWSADLGIFFIPDWTEQ